MDGIIPNRVEGITLRGEKKDEESHENRRILKLLRRLRTVNFPRRNLQSETQWQLEHPKVFVEEH